MGLVISKRKTKKKRRKEKKRERTTRKAVFFTVSNRQAPRWRADADLRNMNIKAQRGQQRCFTDSLFLLLFLLLLLPSRRSSSVIISFSLFSRRRRRSVPRTGRSKVLKAFCRETMAKLKGGRDKWLLEDQARFDLMASGSRLNRRLRLFLLFLQNLKWDVYPSGSCAIPRVQRGVEGYIRD